MAIFSRDFLCFWQESNSLEEKPLNSEGDGSDSKLGFPPLEN